VLWLLVVAIATAVVVLVAFALTTLVSEPATVVAIVVIVALSVLLDLAWKHSPRHGAPSATRKAQALTPS
jgi:hypothetical protein